MPSPSSYELLSLKIVRTYTGTDLPTQVIFCKLVSESLAENHQRLLQGLDHQDFVQVHFALHKVKSAMVYVVESENLSSIVQGLSLCEQAFQTNIEPVFEENLFEEIVYAIELVMKEVDLYRNSLEE